MMMATHRVCRAGNGSSNPASDAKNTVSIARRQAALGAVLLVQADERVDHHHGHVLVPDAMANLAAVPAPGESSRSPTAPKPGSRPSVPALVPTYLAEVLDLFNRKIVGWPIKPCMTADIVTNALTMAWYRRKPESGVIFHSARGSQYASHATRARQQHLRQCERGILLAEALIPPPDTAGSHMVNACTASSCTTG